MDQLRIELKEWEGEFKTKHGRAPTRQDIKDNPTIAAKYKQYNASKMASTKAKEPVKTPVKKRKLSKPSDAVVPSLAHASPPKAKFVHANSPSKLKKLVQDASKARSDPFASSSHHSRQAAAPDSPSMRNPFAVSPKKDSPNTKFMKALLEQAAKEEREAKAAAGSGGPSWEELLGGGSAANDGAARESFVDAIKGKKKGKDLDMTDVFGPSPVKPDAQAFKPLLDDSPVKPIVASTVPNTKSIPSKRPAKTAFDAPNEVEDPTSKKNRRSTKGKAVNTVGVKKVTSIKVPEPKVLDFRDDDGGSDYDEDDEDETMRQASPRGKVVIRHRLRPVREGSPELPSSLIFDHARGWPGQTMREDEAKGREEDEKLPEAMDDLLSLSPTKTRLKHEAIKKDQLVKRLLGEPSVRRKRAGLEDLDDEAPDEDGAAEAAVSGDEDWASESDGWNRIEGDLEDW